MAETRLKEYRAKRDFSRTAEPSGSGGTAAGGWRYLIQKHDATRLHFDFRLELNGVLLSWAVPNGPSLDPAEKRLAVHVEDHPLDYGDFEGTIPKGEYGGGTVMLWDEGTWEPVGDPDEGLARGDFKFVLHGERLNGKWVLVRMRRKPGERGKHENWLLIKERDAFATEEAKPITERALKSVRSGRTMAEIAAGNVEWVNSGFNIRRDTADPAPVRKTAAKAKPARGKAPKARAAKTAAADPDEGPPAFVAPQLATLAAAAPSGEGWIHEIKFDGYRALAAVGGGRARIYTRTGLDWTDRFRPLVRPLLDLPCRSALLDGEVAVEDKDGRTDFSALQAVLGEGGGKGIGYHVFDILALDGEDLRRLPLVARKERLKALLAGEPRTGPLFYSDHVVGHGAEMLERSCGMGLEGIVSKRADAPYRSERSKSWLKVKCGMGQEFVIIGWRPSDVKTRPFSSLLLAVRDGERLVYCGRVGSGFGERELAAVWPELRKRAVKTPPVDDIPADIRRDAHFVKPELVAEIAFRGWTGDGAVRQAAFKGLRVDKRVADVVAERPVADSPPEPTAKAAKPTATKRTHRLLPLEPAKTKAKPPSDPPSIISVERDQDRGSITVEGIRITHPDRVVFPGQGITKRRLAEYFVAIAPRMLPHVVGRPLSLVRCPQGAGGDCFFQKHASPGFPDAFRPVTIREKEGSDIYLYIEDIAGLVACVQMGVLELHVWGSHVKTLEKPDRLVFDFDPDEDMPFSVVRAAAEDMRARLKALKLESFPMLTGGKGIHVVVPLAPKNGWDDIRAFAEALARTIAAEEPDRYLAVATKARRKGKIFIDYLRNGRGATAIAPFSTRAKKGAPLAWPVSWTALPKIETARLATVETAADLLKTTRRDPWAGYFDIDQVLPLAALRGG